MSTPNGDDSDNIQTGQDAMDDEASASSLGASDELEEALREATESVEARAAELSMLRPMARNF